MLTKKQMDLLSFIDRRLKRDGVPPSFDEMKDALDLRSKSGIHRLITALEERGFIRRLPHKARALEIVKLPETLVGAHEVAGGQPVDLDAARSERQSEAQSSSTRSSGQSFGNGVAELDVMGRIAAGVPIAAISEISNRIAVPSSMIGSHGSHYALEVKGESMIGAGINDGDVVVIKETNLAENGDIVVAVVEDHEATLKRFIRKGEIIALEAANPAFETRMFPVGDVKVQGRLVGLIRSY